MSALKKYIIEEMKNMTSKTEEAYEEAANRVMDRLLDPTADFTRVTGKQTKKKSYDQLGDLSKQHMKILKLLQTEGSLSRQEIANKTGIKIGAVCGRILEMRANNFVFEDGTKTDPDTGREVTTIAAIV